MYEVKNQEKFYVGEKSLLFLSLLNFNQNKFGVFAKKCGTVVKTAFHFHGWSFQERTNLSKKTELSQFLGSRASNLRNLVKTSCTLVKAAFYMYEGTIREEIDVGEKSCLFLSLSNFNQNMFGVFAKN